MLMHQARGSVFGKIDIFSQVKFLLGISNGCQVLPWIALIPTFVQVSILSVFCRYADRADLES